MLTVCQIMFKAKWKRIIAVSAAMYLSEKKVFIFSGSLSGYIEYMVARGGRGFNRDCRQKSTKKPLDAATIKKSPEGTDIEPKSELDWVLVLVLSGSCGCGSYLATSLSLKTLPSVSTANDRGFFSVACFSISFSFRASSTVLSKGTM